jgi:hypothetical protein
MQHPFRTVVLVLGTSLAAGGRPGLAPVSLPAPQTDGTKPLMQALAAGDRSRLRAGSAAAAGARQPAAAWGINRAREGKRTAPSARNWQEIEVLVVDAIGAYAYDAAANTLTPLVAGKLVVATSPLQSDLR